MTQPRSSHAKFDDFWLSVCLSVCVSVRLSESLAVCVSVRLSESLAVCVSVCLRAVSQSVAVPLLFRILYTTVRLQPRVNLNSHENYVMDSVANVT